MLQRLPFSYAFYNFYFILEGLYTRGNPKKAAVRNEFKQSVELVSNVELVIASYATVQEEYRDKLLRVLKKRGKTLNVDGILDLLVNSRGDLHHFQNNPNLAQPTTFNQDEFEVVAWLTFALAEAAIKDRIKALDLKAKSDQI